MKPSILIMVLVLSTASNAGAWNKAGHMTTGAIAYTQLLEKDPVALAKVIEILKSHPDYDDWAQHAEHVDTSIRDQVLFMHAARWPDDVRGTSDDRRTWHYINIPYSSDGTATTPVPSGQENLYFAFRANLAIVQGTASDAKKAVAICWLLHLTGDAHMPLHVVELFNASFKHGDNGGTKCFIKPSSSEAPETLHHYWDALVQVSERSARVSQKADLLATMFPAASLPEFAPAFVPADFETKWAEQESLKIAQDFAYKSGAAMIDLAKFEQLAKPLPTTYETTVRPIAQRRAALAGYRIAAMLESAF